MLTCDYSGLQEREGEHLRGLFLLSEPPQRVLFQALACLHLHIRGQRTDLADWVTPRSLVELDGLLDGSKMRGTKYLTRASGEYFEGREQPRNYSLYSLKLVSSCSTIITKVSCCYHGVQRVIRPYQWRQRCQERKCTVQYRRVHLTEIRLCSCGRRNSRSLRGSPFDRGPQHYRGRARGW